MSIYTNRNAVIPAGMPESRAMDGSLDNSQVLDLALLYCEASHPCDWILASMPE